MKLALRLTTIATVLATASCLPLQNAGASGDFGPSYTMFRAWTAPDIPLERFQAGDLGVVQPGMRRVYLYTAWRAFALGPKIASAPGLAGGLARADGSAFNQGWEDAGTSYQALTTRLAALLHLPVDDAAVRKILACPPAATAYAMTVFDAASKRPDATPARLDAWLLAQQKVGEACQVADDFRYRYGSEKTPTIAPPAPLPDKEPLYWRQLNDYQRAAWQFQGAHYAESTALFERIGATAGHPMHDLGAYLALRSEVRRAVVGGIKDVDAARRDEQARALERRGDAILADATLAPLHEPTRALLRAMRVGLTPESRMQELTRYLDNPNADPFALDRLGDWAVLANDTKPQDLHALQANHAFVEWIETVRGCTGVAPNPACALAAVHAMDRWQRTPSRAWMVAALMLAESAPPALLDAGMALTPDDPAYVTVRYHLARLYRLQGKPDTARAIADSVLQRQLSPGTRNLLRQERFAVATSVADAGAYLLRTNVDYAKRMPASETAHEPMLDDDGLAWLDEGVSVADLIAVAGQSSLPRALRARIAGAAWIRAGLLDDYDAGKQAGVLLAELAPATAPAVARYTGAGSAPARRHVVLAEAVRFGLAAQQTMESVKVAPVAPDEATASGWCSFKPVASLVRAELAVSGFAWRFPPPPDTGHADVRRAELARLGAMKSATGVLGDDVLAWSVSHPRDPELPWLLHVVVQSTRGGCVDPDAKTLSRKAWDVLHKRYAGSEWARKTPYFY